jgi:patatin-like phospholipase/acyl hydrolase
MLKQDLEDGMVVLCENGGVFLVVAGNIVRHNNRSLSLNSDYNKDLIYSGVSDFNIVKVFKFNTAYSFDAVKDQHTKYLDCIWEREWPEILMTVAEVEEALEVKNLRIVKEH